MNETSTQRRVMPWSPAARDADGRSPLPDAPADAGTLRPTSARFWGVVGLLVLTSVTSLVVASISVWLVPVYMTAMVLIFLAPRSNRPSVTATTPEASADASDAPATDSPESVADLEAVAEQAEGAAEPVTTVIPSAPELTPPKPRKRRAKGKRAAKAAALAEASSTEPTWIRVGPGKFVRADAQPEPSGTETPQATEVQTGAESPPRDDAEMVAPSTPAAFEDVVQVVEQDLDEEPTPAVDVERQLDEPGSFGLANDADVMESQLDEEYGNAPSALVEPVSSVAVPVEDFPDEPKPEDEPTEETPATAEAEYPQWDEAPIVTEVDSGITIEAEPQTWAEAESIATDTPVAFEEADRTVELDRFEEPATPGDVEERPCELASDDAVDATEPIDRGWDGEYGNAPSASVQDSNDEWGWDGEYGNAPSASVQNPNDGWEWDGEYGNAPSASVQDPAWESAPEFTRNDAPECDREPKVEALAIGNAEARIPGEAEVVSESEVEGTTQNEDALVSSSSSLPAQGRTASLVRVQAARTKPHGIIARGVSPRPRLQSRRDRRPRSAGSASSDRRVNVRDSGTSRREVRRHGQHRRRFFPRSPPQRE